MDSKIKHCGPLYIYNKRWYFRLVNNKNNKYKRSRALLEDYNSNQGLIICYTPDHLPESTVPFVTNDGRPIHIFAFFESYIEFCNYSKFFNHHERAFYEVVFGNLPQKPHFDIDIDRDEFAILYPNDNVNDVAPQLLQHVINGCIEVIGSVNIERDILIYSSTGTKKYSYHIVITNKCHSNNKEAKAFYDLVVQKVSVLTNNRYLNFIDPSVYSHCQQFRIVGCQKWGSGRPKLFNESFILNNNEYTHQYPENVSDPLIKELVILYESLLGFTGVCSYLPSYIPPKLITYNTESLTDLDDATVNYCMRLLHEKMDPCPFTVREIQGNRICLKREAPSPCPICTFTVNGKVHHRVHENEHPYMFIKDGKIYWDCRRSLGAPKFLLGHRAFTLAELQENQSVVYDEDLGGTFTFGDYDIVVSKSPEPTGPTNLIIPPPEILTQNVINQVSQISKHKDIKKDVRRDNATLDHIKTKLTPEPIQSTPLSGITMASNGTEYSIYNI